MRRNILFYQKSINYKDNLLGFKIHYFQLNMHFSRYSFILAVFITFIKFTSNEMSYDNTNEISNNYISIKLLNMIKDKYNLQKSSLSLYTL